MSTFTPAQAAAIAARGNVLVIAGAGTGKTRTLIERCLQLLRDGAALDQMLLVTFTEAAAAELRARLRKALEEELKAATSLRAPDPRASVLDCGGPPPLSDAHDAQEHQRTDALQKLAERPTMPMETAPSANPSASEPTAPFPIPHSLSPSPADLLAEHLALLDTAQISTLHSFCLRLVREHFHHLAIDPQLVILDERQTRPLARACLTDLLAEHYAGRHPHSSAVQQLLRRAGRGSDEPLRALVWQLHRYTQTLPDPDAWCAAQLAAFRDPAPAQWQTWLHEALADWRAEWLPALAAAPAVPALKQAAAALQDLAELRPTQASTAAHTALSALLAADATDNWKRKKTELRPPFAKLFDEAAFFHALLAPSSSSHSLSPIPHPPSPSSALTEDWEWSRHEMAALIQLTRQSTENFSEAKRQLGGVDFADLEQFALRLLRDETTGVARQCRARFTHVCVDEYQDINAAQDAILRAVSGTGAAANRFLVGDLKQSIYRFRLANPRIFASYAKAWRSPVGRDSVEPHLERSEASAASIPGRDTLRQDTRSTCASPVGQCGSTESHPTAEVIALAENFRSREAILDFVNPLFRALMRESIGGVAYDADAELKFGNPAGRAALRSPVPAASSHVELHLLTNDATEDEPTDATTDLLDLLAVEREARCVALRLHALHASGHEIRDDATKPPRPVEWRDMVVLMRSPGSRVESFAQEFHRIGVPLHAARGGFYEALEVSDLLNLLRLLDNPLQDLPLLAVLRSPLVAMSLEDLVALRASSDERLFWDALVKAARTPTSAAARGDGADTNAAALPPHPSPLPPGEGASPDAPRSLGAPGSEPAIAVGPPNSEPASPTPPLSNILPLPAGEGRGEGERSQPPSAPSTPTAAPLFTSHSSPLTKAFSFLARFTAWRELLRLSSLTQCLERVLAETHYESLLLAEPRGAERVANVRRLLDLARQFDPYQRQGLHRFLQFIAAQEEA